MRGKSFLSVVLVLGLALLAGCAKAPQQSVDEAKAALEAARTEGADRYAPELFNAAQDSLNAAMAEIEAQNSKFALTRNYDRAQQQLEAAKTSANAAKDAVTAKKEEVKAEAQNLMTQAQAAVDEVKTLMAKAPRGKEGRQVLDQMQTELSGVEATIAEGSSLMDAGDYAAARDKFQAALEKANSLKQELSDAISKKTTLSRD
jgi:tetratricopeptide (TPR) repeat protein